MDRVALLASSPLFEMLSNEELVDICGRLVLQTFPQGAVIFSEGSITDGMFLIASGEVEVFQGPRKGPLARLGRGECFGEMALVDKDYRSATVRAAEDVELLHLSTEALAAFRSCQKDGFGFLVMNIARLLSARLRDANRQM